MISVIKNLLNVIKKLKALDNDYGFINHNKTRTAVRYFKACCDTVYNHLLPLGNSTVLFHTFLLKKQLLIN